MDINRKPFQGVLNIIRFNWHFYIMAAIGLAAFYSLSFHLPIPFQSFALYIIIWIVFAIGGSLIISFYVYDLSELYELNWLQNIDPEHVLNINAGFDEISKILKQKFPKSKLSICDFYDREKHTEVSIKRARAAYPPPIDTIHVSTSELPFHDGTFDNTLAFLSAHEIRDRAERVQFFKELKRITKPDGNIFVTEHLRDLNNFMAYSIGFFHFHTKSIWIDTFNQAGLIIDDEIKTTPFITTFKLKNGSTL